MELPMPNKLAFEKSPYLLQHKDNPVDWLPWGEEAFARARAEDKPLLVSIGYSTCHWCHVMEHESFSDPAVAKLMNEYLVCVKVDREERPDVDRVCMNAVSALTGQGGWPLNCFMTPDGRPFYGGTYFPPKPAFQRPSWTQLVEAIGRAWKDPEGRRRVLRDADAVAEALKGLECRAEASEILDAAPLEALHAHLRRAHDVENGGFAWAPKFPLPIYQHALLRLSMRWAGEGDAAKAAEAAELAFHALRAMAKGGIHDHLGGGFARYSTDERWHVPHFEKMLYDNAQLLLNYVEAWALGRDPLFKETAEGIAAYVLRDLRAPEGAFYSAEDADSVPPAGRPGAGRHGGKAEGAFYTWTYAELEAVLGPELTALFAGSYGAEKDGNVLHDPQNEFVGLNVLYDRRDSLAAETGGAAGLAPEVLAARLAEAKRRLFEARTRRERPQRDEKCLASWNGLMVAGLARAGFLLERRDWIEAAARAADFFLTRMWEADCGRLWRRFAAGERAVEGQLDDYAFLAWGCLELHQATLEPRWLDACRALLEAAQVRFGDDDGLYFLAGREGDPHLPVRVKDVHDNVEPSPVGVLVDLQLRLWNLGGDPSLRAQAERTLRACYADLLKAPAGGAFLVGVLDRYLAEPVRVVLTEGPGRESLWACLRSVFLPRLDVVGARADGGLPLPGSAQGYSSKTGQAAAFVCKGLACRPPVSSPADLLEILRSL
jgi:uncharacterized protein YyaL (SSP411 family)